MTATDPDLDRLWETFHRAVNMSSDELRRWLLTEASGEEAFAADPDLDLPATGRHVVRILGKRKRDLTPDDTEVMRDVVDLVADRMADAPPQRAGDEVWRHTLMSVGHDPLRPRGEEPPPAES